MSSRGAAPARGAARRQTSVAETRGSTRVHAQSRSTRAPEKPGRPPARLQLDSDESSSGSDSVDSDVERLAAASIDQRRGGGRNIEAIVAQAEERATLAAEERAGNAVQVRCEPRCSV